MTLFNTLAFLRRRHLIPMQFLLAYVYRRIDGKVSVCKHCGRFTMEAKASYCERAECRLMGMELFLEEVQAHLGRSEYSHIVNGDEIR
jgi:hypothetical protein